MAQVRQLFAAMATGGFFGVETIKHVDGGLFNDDSVLLLDADSLRILAEVCGLNWSAIEPGSRHFIRAWSGPGQTLAARRGFHGEGGHPVSR